MTWVNQVVVNAPEIFLFLALAIVSTVTVDETGTWWISLAFVGFALLSARMLLDYYIARHEVSDEGLAYRKLSGARKITRLSEVRSVRYATMMKWFRLESRGGEGMAGGRAR